MYWSKASETSVGRRREGKGRKGKERKGKKRNEMK
jgi:hypothetical protein